MSEPILQRESQFECPRIYVACLAAYIYGHLHGRWIDADQDADAIRAEIAAMLAASPISLAEEAAIHDFEGFEGVNLEEYASIDHVVAIAGFIAAHGTLGAKVLPAETWAKLSRRLKTILVPMTV